MRALGRVPCVVAVRRLVDRGFESRSVYLETGLKPVSHRERCVEGYDNRINAKHRTQYITVLCSDFCVSRAM